VSAHRDGDNPRVGLAWGRRGAREAAERGDILVVIDTLRFSTAAATAVHHGALIYPCPPDAVLARALAARVGAEVAAVGAGPDSPVPTSTRFSLSPRSYLGIEPGTRVVLPSPNGSTCCRYGERAAALFVAAPVNARAVAGAVSQLLSSAVGLRATLLACGERWRLPDEEGVLRFALEDYLGAGAVLAALPFSQSSEAQVCAATFSAVRGRLETMLWECESGQELRAKGLGEDVHAAAQVDTFDTAPVLRGECLDVFHPPADPVRA
jgi:2-phosphosulfolactate phosphatase